MNKFCTSIEQAKKLIELGIDVNTADMYYHNRVDIPDNYPLPIEWKCNNPLLSQEIPCWSVGRLIELMPYRIFDNGVSKYLSIVKDESDTFCITYYDITIAAFEDIASACFKAIVWLIENHYINKL